MRRFLMIMLAAVLLCLAGCSDREPPKKAAVDDGLLAMEELTGRYDISFQGEAESGSRTVDLVILNDRLTFALYPDKTLDSEFSFDSYDPQTGEARLQRRRQDVNGAFSVSCEITFAETDGKITVSGNWTITRENMPEESCTLSGEKIEER